MDSANQDLLIRIGADISELTSGMRSAQDQIRGFGQQASESSGLTIGKLAGIVGATAIVSKAFGVVKESVGKAFQRIDTMESFERVMSAITGSTEETNAALEKTRGIVDGTAYGLDIAAKGVQDFVTRGMSVDKATDTIEAWGDAVAFYGDGSNEQFASVSDALAKMISKGKVDMQQMNRLFEAGIDGVGMYAQATGQSYDSVQADLSKGAITAEDFVNTVSTAMMEGTNGVIKIKGAAKDMGASWGASFDNAAAAVTRGVVEIISEIDRLLTENGLPTMREMILDFGKKFGEGLKMAAKGIEPFANAVKAISEFLGPIMPLIQAVGIAIGVFIGIIATMGTVVGVIKLVTSAWETLQIVMMLNPWALAIAGVVALAFLIYKYWDEIVAYTTMAWGAIKEFFSGLWSSIVSTATAAWTGFVDFLTGIWESISSSASGAWDGLTEGVTSVVDSVVQAWTGFVEKVTAVWDTITAVATAVWETVKAAFMAAIAPIVEYVSTQFQTMVTGITGIFDGLSAFFSGVWEAIKQIFVGGLLVITQLLTGDLRGAMESAAQIFTNVREAATTAWNGIKSAIGSAVSMISTLVSTAFNFIKGIVTSAMSAIGSAVSAGWNAVKSAVSSAMSAISSAVTAGWNAVKSAITSAMAAIVSGIVSGWNKAKSAITSAMSAILSAIKSGFSNAVSAAKSAITNMVSAITSGFTRMVGAIVSAMVRVVSSIKSGWNSAVSFLKGINLADIGRQIIAGLARGITNAVGLVKDAVKTAASAITGKLKSILNIQSPSRVMATLGGFVGEGLADGILSTRRTLEDASASMASWATPQMDDVQVADIVTPKNSARLQMGTTRAYEDVEHSIAERDEDAKRAAYINLELGGRDYETFVEDIDNNIKRKERLKRKTTRGN